MSAAADEITITIPASQAAQRHIEGLQDTLTKRNAQIERLSAQLEEALTGEPNQAALAKAYKRGWEAAANQLMQAAHDAAQSLGKVSKAAFSVYLQSQKRDS